MRIVDDVLGAFEFLTCIPVRSRNSSAVPLSRAAAWFPLVGLATGVLAVLFHNFLTPHFNPSISALFVVVFLAAITGGLHEDGLADVADAFGGGWNREQILLILKDSRIGSYGAMALIFSLAGRWQMLAAIPAHRFAGTLISAQVLCRWTVLPLGHFLKPARGQEGQGARIAERLGWGTLMFGSLFAFGVTAYFLQERFWIPILAVCAVALISGGYYKRRIGGVTGDCFGATTQLAEIAVYVCGVWNT
jgi:adenosylcobinamide-GDP ribazoletransferase